MARKKTRAEKVKSTYRLRNFRMDQEATVTRREISAFGYLSSEYILADLGKTLLYSALIITLLFAARAYL